MRKLFSLLIIFLLIFTYSIPAYAEDIFNENNPINQDQETGENEEESVENELEDEPSDSSEDEEGSVPDNESEEKSEGEVLEGDLSDSSEDEDDDNEVILPDPPQVPLGNPSIMGTFSVQSGPDYNLLISSFNSDHEVYVNGNDDPEDPDAIHGSIIEKYLISSMGKDPLIAIKGWDTNGNVTALGVEYKTDNGNWHYSNDSWMIYIGTPPKYEAPNGDTYEWYEEGYKSNDWIPAYEIDHRGTGNFLTEGGEWIWSENYGASSGDLDEIVYFRNKLEGHAVIDISPIFEGWVDNGDGTYRAYFGYENRSTDASGDPMDVNLAMGSPENKITGPADDSLFPEDFTYPNVVSGRPGRTDYFPNALVEIPDWDGTNIVWTLDGRTATAGLSGPEHVIDISPIFEGWVDNGDGSYRAYFGYENRSVTAGGDPWDVTLLMGSTQNHITGNADDSLFPEDFTYPNVVSGRPGRTDYFPNALVEIPDWDGTNIVWTLDGRTATAGLSGPEHKGEIDISPIFEGWVDNGDGTYRAYFGYENRSTDAFGDPMDVNLPMGTPENKVTDNADDSLFPEDFTYPNVIPDRPGRTDWFPNALVEIPDWDGTNIVWTLDGRTATAGLSGPEHKAEIDISPIFEGWVDNGDGTYRAYFGYENRSTDAFGDPMDVNLPMGTPENKVTDNADDSLFPEDFTYPNVIPDRPGRTDWFPNALVEIPDWDGTTVVWTLDGRTATAGLEGPEHVVELHPIFEGYVDNGDGTYRAYFGYENKSVTAGGDPWDVHIPMGTSQNKITGNADDSLFPEDFTYPNVVPGRPGRTDWFPNALVEIPDWDGTNIVWTLDGRTATAGLSGPEHVIDISPIFEGWVDNGDGSYRAYFGYENRSVTAGGDPWDVTLLMGSTQNHITGNADDSLFPEDFTYPNVVSGRPGRTDYFPNALVEIPDWDGTNIVWTLDGRTATAGLSGPEHKGEIDISPIFEGWVDNGDGTYRAYFGYENRSTDAFGDPMDVNLPMGTPENKVTDNADDSLFPEDFTYPNVIPDRPGRTDWFPNALVEIPDWDGTNIVWTLDGRTATAGLSGPEHKAEIDISPIFEGWVDNGDGTYRAYFGYENRSTDAFGDPMDVNLPMGTPENKVTDNADDSLFPEDFTYPNVIPDRPGRTDWFPNALVEIPDWDGTNIVWTLDGRTATAGLSGPEHKAEIDISPIFEGWVDNGDGTYRAYFGYENRSTDAFGDPMDVNLPMGTPENKVTDNADDSLFPEDFTYPNVVPGRPGRTDWFPNALVEIPDWDGTTVVWTLDGRTATAGLEGTEHVYYEITFDSNGGSSVPNQSVLFGDTVEKPTDPTRSGYTFTGWTFDGSSYDFEWPVIGNMILVAGWRSNTTDGGGDGGGGNDATIDAVKDYISTAKNTSVDVETSELMANDIDADDFVSVQNPINGSVSRSGTTVTFTPTEDFVGTAYFYYTIESGGDSDNGLVVVTVEEIVEINQENTPLGGGNPKALIVIDPEITPLGIIDYSMPYIMGYPDTTFRPDREVTRGEMAAIFARILGLDLSNPGEAMYQDVNPEDWYYKYIQSVSRVGLFSGYDDNTFKPNRPVTHAEIASAFSEYWKLRGIEVASEGDYYSDISGHWAEDMINRLYNAGISVSYVNGTFKPDTFTTRTELVVFVNRSLNRPEEFKDTPSFRDVVPTYWGYGAIEAANGYREPESVRLTE